MNKKNFRKDINGLRAIAVLVVAIFHVCAFNSFSNHKLPFSLDGGYVGVDIFFVISGFLMTSIICNGLAANKFSTWTFWKNRAKRICPALFVAVTLFYIIGFVLLVNIDEFHEFNKEAPLALTFVSNIRFAQHDGYFAVNSMSKMLLHTWSLSVEWQFYVIYPVLLVLLNKFKNPIILKSTIVAIFLISLVLSIVLIDEKNYFLLHARAWELLCGALVFLFPIKALQSLSTKTKSIIEIVGILLILSIFLRSSVSVWSTYIVIPSVIGTMLVLATNNDKSILSNGLIQYIGKISYSLYIYHWLVFSILCRIGLINNFVVVFIITLTLSILSYQYIESSRKYGWGFLVMYFTVFGGCLYTADKYGFDERYNLTIPFGGGNGVPDIESFFNNKEHETQILMIGDSHAKHFMEYMNSHNIKAQILANNGTYCYDANHCSVSKKDFMNRILARYGSVQGYIDYKNKIVDSLPDSVPFFISQRWIQHFSKISFDYAYSKSTAIPNDEALERGIGDFIRKYKNRKFYIIGSIYGANAIDTVKECQMIKDHNKYLPKVFLNNMNCSANKLMLDESFINMNHYLQKYFSQFDNVQFINPNDVLCENGYCKIFTDENKPIFFDDNHLSSYGANYIGNKMFNFVIDKAE